MENCQRDIQIAFFNEMEKIFDKMNINIEDVTAAASTNGTSCQLLQDSLAATASR